VIEFLDAQGPESSTVDFVGGPRNKERTALDDRPSEIELPGGSYVRSVQCADDGALRYVWNPRTADLTDG
jgi:hypothetical protein